MGRRKNTMTDQQDRGAQVRTAPGSQSSLEEAVRAGLVESHADRVVVPAKFSPNGQDLVQVYDRFAVAERVTDPEQFIRAALAMCGGVEQAKKLFNTAWDTAKRTPIRHKLVKGVKKPQQSLEKMAREAMKAGLAATLEDAKAQLQRTFKVQ